MRISSVRAPNVRSWIAYNVMCTFEMNCWQMSLTEHEHFVSTEMIKRVRSWLYFYICSHVNNSYRILDAFFFVFIAICTAYARTLFALFGQKSAIFLFYKYQCKGSSRLRNSRLRNSRLSNTNCLEEKKPICSWNFFFWKPISSRKKISPFNKIQFVQAILSTIPPYGNFFSKWSPCLQKKCSLFAICYSKNAMLCK